MKRDFNITISEEMRAKALPISELGYITAYAIVNSYASAPYMLVCGLAIQDIPDDNPFAYICKYVTQFNLMVKHHVEGEVSMWMNMGYSFIDAAEEWTK